MWYILIILKYFTTGQGGHFMVKCPFIVPGAARTDRPLIL